MTANELRNLIAFRERQRNEEKDSARREQLNRRLRQLRQELRKASSQDSVPNTSKRPSE